MMITLWSSPKHLMSRVCGALLVALIGLAGCGENVEPVETTPAVCGDGAVDLGEACDDGNTADGDGCSSKCLQENGRQCSANEECVSQVCDDTEAMPVCEPADTVGNGRIEGEEGCDDGNVEDSDGCNSAGKIELGQPCETPRACASGVCDANEAPAVCEQDGVMGNGKLDAGEFCDDGNTTAGDGCDASGKKEAGQPCVAGDECASGTCDDDMAPATCG